VSLGSNAVDIADAIPVHWRSNRGYIRLLLMEAIEEPDRMTEWPSIRAEVEAAAADFGVKANRAARRFWL
jgi:hypothetical protein